MKTRNIISTLAATAFAFFLTGCEGEQEPVIIEGDLPIKTSCLFMVGDATPNGWNIDNPTPLEASADDALVFSWEGSLYKGEIKLCLTTGSFDAPFIRPEVGGTEISKTDITDQKFIMHSGDPDNKWRVAYAGKYRLTFNLRNWTMSTQFLGENDAPVVEAIESDVLYMIGDATPNGWDNNNPTELVMKSKYIFEYEGELKPGEMKACLEKGSWDVPFIRPSSADCKIGKDGVESNDFVFTTGPDNKWKIADHGIYRLTFDLEHWTIKAEYLADITVTKEPIETENLYMIGDATPNGWSMDNATQFTKSATDPYVFTWEGELVQGDMKACIVKDGSFSCPFLRPAADNVDITSEGVSSPDFVFTTSPDDKWHVKEAGRYLITFNLKEWTITVNKK